MPDFAERMKLSAALGSAQAKSTFASAMIWLWLSKPMGSHFGVGAQPILVYFSGDWDVHWGYRILTHGNINP